MTLDKSLEQKLQVVTLKLIQQRIRLFLEANSVVRWSEEPDSCRTLDRVLITPGYSSKVGMPTVADCILVFRGLITQSI